MTEEKAVLPPDPGPRIGDGPWNVLQALASGDKVALAGALQRQREAYREQFGCYPEEMLRVCPECPETLPDAEAAACPIWLGMKPLLDDPDEVVSMAARERLGHEHTVAEIPCRTCGGSLCTIFFCYADDDRGGAK